MMAPNQKTSFLVLAVCCTILYHVNAGVIDRTQEDWINSLKSDQLDNDEIESLSIDDAHVDKDLDQELDSIESKRSAGSNSTGNDGVSAGEIIAAINGKHREEIHVKIVDGDIAVKIPTGKEDELEKKSALRYTGRLWQDRKVHYVFDASISASVRSQIQKAMAEYENKTCLRFFLATNTALIKNWIKFTKKSGCWSYVGRTGGQQEISIGVGCSGIGTIIHELMHAMGFYHEQSRYDRDQNIEVLWENIPRSQPRCFDINSSGLPPVINLLEGNQNCLYQNIVAGLIHTIFGKHKSKKRANEHNFLKHSSTKVQLQGTVYDFNSIMQYGNKAFSKNGKDTLRSIKNPGRLFGQRSGFSTLDAQEINILYQCKKAGAGFSEWSDWGPCLNDRSTGNLYIKRQKYCFETDRSLCPGASTRGVIEDRQPVSCANTTCVVDGHWSRWSEWGACTKSCGLGGQRTRTRKCTDPVPKCGGAACVGVSSQTGNCYRGRCDLGPDDCEFERAKNPTCHWKHWNQTGSTLHWRIHTGPTPSSNTGPNGDASVNTNGAGYYMYVETSYPVVKDQIGIMSSKSFPPTNNRTITFKYAMGGQTIRYLKVNKVDNNGAKTQLFRKNGHQSFLWLPASISFASPVNYTIQFEMQSGDDYRSDVAVDDIFFADACSTTPCKNGGSCTVLPTGEFKCACTVDWTGLTCETSTNPCIPSPCKNGGSCTAVEGIAQCSCMPGYTGATCETQIDNCASNPCKNGGTCTNGVNSFTCTCAPAWTGSTCATSTNDCASNPCQNGGTCVDGVNSFTCTCAPGFTGSTCAINIDDCASKPCQNGGTCVDGVNSFTCTCAPGFTGSTCATNIDDCASAPCKNGGTCTDGVNSFTCTCAAGWTGSTCTQLIDNCGQNPCQNGGTCTNGVNSYTCTCAVGFTGRNCKININDCSQNPCQNGGTCADGFNSFTCTCAPGFTGSTCATNIDDCASIPCQNGGTCVDGVNSFTCTCAPGFTGSTCAININDCSQNPCQNGGTCADGVNSFTCTCAAGFTGSTCAININDCSQNPCLNGGTCADGVNSFTCTCAPGFTGSTCATNINDCSQNPCQNGGTCVDGVNSFTCTCAPGFTGSTCATNINDCSQNPCQNGGTCADGVNSFTCTCAPGFTGSTCATNINDCSQNPCQNGGTCADGVNSFTCTCAPGFTGSTCATNIDDCASAPCKNGGTCVDGVNSFTCTCAPGFTGSTCAINIDDCASRPCQNGGTCVDGVNSFTCTCASGFTGSTCGININDCSQNPCQNGGTCADGVNSFTCTCAPGFTGSTCAINIDDCSQNPCLNGGTCADGVNSFTCTCAPGFTGSTCATNIDDCASKPCQNGGTCVDGVNSFTCTCAPGFTGSTCAINIDDCASKPCKNGGTCTDGVNTFTCTCAAGWTGSTCTQLIDNCVPNPCKNGGTCSNGVNSFTCKCAKGWEGATCTTVMTPPPPTPTTMTTTKAPTTRPPGNFVDLLSCDFECGFCSWKQNKSDVFDWTRQRGETSSHYTGPSNDHTTAKSGYYLYTEASAPRKPNHNAILTSPTMQSDGKPRCVDLFYHMFGSGIGSLVVSATYNGVAHEVFRTDGNKGNKWNHGKGTLNVPSGLDFTVSIESVQGSSLKDYHWEGDTAIDDIRVWPGACPASSSTPSVLACPIERKSFCSWTQPTTDDGNWRQRTSKNGYWWLFGDASTDKSDDATATATSTDKSNDATATATSTDKSSDATATNNEVDDPRRRGSKGPRRALSGKRDHYAYFRGRKGSNTENAILQSAAFSATKQSCMRFFAHMSGRKIGSLAVNKVDPLGAKTQLSKHTGNQKNRWFESAVTIPAGQNFKIDIVATQGRKATIAIDDITVSPGRCDMPKIKFRCDFSAGACGLQQNHDDHCDWSIVSSNGGKSLQWKANDCHGDGDSGDEYFALLSKEARVPTRGGCVTIDFHLGKGDVCELEVRLLKDDGSKRGNKKRSHNDEDRIYYRKAKSRNGKKQTIRATIPPPRGGCPMKLIELEAILSERNYWYGKRCKEVNIDEITFREGICGNN